MHHCCLCLALLDVLELDWGFVVFRVPWRHLFHDDIAEQASKVFHSPSRHSFIADCTSGWSRVSLKHGDVTVC